MPPSAWSAPGSSSAWRLHVRGGRLGQEDFVVEQHAYADAGPTGRIQSLVLVCSGFCKEHADA